MQQVTSLATVSTTIPTCSDPRKGVRHADTSRAKGSPAGRWWADAAAALVVSVSILRDGWANLSGAITGLMDRRPTRFDGTDPHPLVHEIDEVLADVGWATDHGARVRDEGHVFHVEAFLVPADGQVVTVERLAAVCRALTEISWKVQDVVVTVVAEVHATHRPR